MTEKKKNSQSCPWWHDAVNSVIQSIYQDRTTSKDKLREKAKNYASNYIALQTEASYVDKNWLINEIADEVEKKLEDAEFNPKPPASLIAQHERSKISKDPEKRYIKLGK